MIDPLTPRPCPNCGSNDTRIADFDPPFTATLTCDACEHDTTLDEDDELIGIVRRDILEKLTRIESICQSVTGLCNKALGEASCLTPRDTTK